MTKIREFLSKVGSKFGILLISIYVIYLGVSFHKIYAQSDSVYKFLSKIWSYSFYQSNNVSITVGKVVVLFGFITISFVISQLLVRKLIHKVLEKTSFDIGTKSAIENLTIYCLTFVFIIVALSLADIPIAALTVIGGALALGLGLGAQGILNNFLSGIILQIEKPIKVGDIISIDEMRGTVEEIGARSTKLILSDNSHIIIPNSKLLENKVSNWTLKNNILRSKIDLELSYQNKPEEVMKEVMDLLAEEKEILKYPESRILLADLAGHSIKYTIYFWIRVDSTLDRQRYESDIKIKLYNLINQKGYKIPNPVQAIEISNKSEFSFPKD